MTEFTTPFLIDGPLMTTPERRTRLIKSMALELVKHGAAGDRGDAIHVLHALHYGVVNIHCLVDEARTLAMQEIVAKEMSAS
jgi:hypothetical protein